MGFIRGFVGVAWLLVKETAEASQVAGLTSLVAAPQLTAECGIELGERRHIIFGHGKGCSRQRLNISRRCCDGPAQPR